MSVAAFVTVDLPYANDYQLQSFDDAMEHRRWTRSGEGYCAEIDQSDSDQVILEGIESLIEEAASDAGVHEWSATCVLSNVVGAA